MRLKDFVNPLVIYIFVWLSVAFLITLNITKNLEEFTGTGAYLVYLTIGIAFFLLIFNKLFGTYAKAARINIENLEKLYKFLFKIWLSLVAIYLVLTKGRVGIVNIITHTSVDYAEIQIPSLWGLNITLCYSLACLAFFIISIGKSSRFLKISFCLICVYPILIFSRNVVLQLSLQLFCMWAINNSANLKHYLYRFVLLGILCILMFGIIGDYRTIDGVANPFAGYVRDEYTDVMNFLPSGFTWLYMYMTANYNNIISSIDHVEPMYVLYPIFMNLVPGVLKNYVFGSDITTNSVVNVLTNDPSLTVASFYAGPILSFGLLGAIIFGTIIQITSLVFYRLARSGNVGYQIAYSSLFASMCFSIFYDAFFTMGTLTQVVLGIYIASRRRRRRFFGL